MDTDDVKPRVRPGQNPRPQPVAALNQFYISRSSSPIT
jgi:hypothetical protein